MHKVDVCFIKNGDIISEFKKVKTIWKNNSAKLIWDINEISNSYRTLLISENLSNKSGVSSIFPSRKNGGAHLYCINTTRRLSLLGKLKNLLYYQLKVLKLLNKYKPVYLFCSNMRFLFLLLLYCKINKIIFIPNFSRFDQLTKINFIFLKLFAVKKIIVAGRHMKKILKANGINADIYVRIPKYPKEFFMRRKLNDFPNFKFTVIYIARIERTKGVFELVKAAVKILSKNKEIGFVIIGNGSDFEELSNLIKRSGYESNIRLLGLKEHLEIGAYLRKSDVLILPSYTEGFTRTWLEGIFMGIPIITTNLAGAEEYFEDGKTAIFVRVRNVEDLVEAILRVYKNPELRKRMHTNLKKLKREILNSPAMAFKDAVLKIIENN